MTSKKGKDLGFQYKIVRRKKSRSVIVKIGKDNSVIVSAPYNAPKGFILSFLEESKNRILKAISENKFVPKKFEEGENFFYLGKKYSLRIVEGEVDVKLEEDSLVVSLPYKDNISLYVEDILEWWYKKEALSICYERVLFYTDKIGVVPNNIRTKKMKSRWGSCSSKKNLNFNWKIIMAPPRVVDSIVVHEMCHLIHLNHSKDFWHTVEKVFPDFKEAHKWLSIHGDSLDW